jgi:hypothetical protein
VSHKARASLNKLEKKKMNRRKFTREVIRLFANKTNCKIQEMGCPCNSCFHNLNEEIDFRHICWLLILGLRDDYLEDNEDNLKFIEEELQRKV